MRGSISNSIVQPRRMLAGKRTEITKIVSLGCPAGRKTVRLGKQRLSEFDSLTHNSDPGTLASSTNVISVSISVSVY
jgi:hypothetical protein